VANIDTRSNNSWFVVLLDYGNRASIDENNMALLPQELSLSSWPQLAQRCQLAALRPPPRKSEDYNVSGEYFAHLTMPLPVAESDEKSQENKPLLTKELTIKILWDDWDGRKWYVVVMDQGLNVNELMIKEGHARFDSKGQETPQELVNSEDELVKEYLKTSKTLNEEAMENRRGMWELGDVNTDDEEY